MNIDSYSNTFNCCGKSTLLPIEILKQEFYMALHKQNIKYLYNIEKDEYFGYDNCSYNILQSIHYFYALFYVMYKEKRNYYNLWLSGQIELDEVPLVDYYLEKYDLDCIRQSLKLQGIDIIPLLRLIDLDYTSEPFFDGIDYMTINPNTTGDPDFRIF